MLTINLYGPQGCGKTRSAEIIHEALKKANILHFINEYSHTEDGKHLLSSESGPWIFDTPSLPEGGAS